MKTNLRICPFKLKDVKEVLEILQSVSVYQLNLKELIKRTNIFLKQTNTYACVVRDNDTIIGFGSLFLIYKLRGTAAIIEDLAVKKERRRQRVGSLIVQHLLKYARKKNCYKISLESSKIAEKFYKLQKFNFYGKIMKRFYKN
jgi:GNAT superfamily N-acetyltransferase